MSKREKIFHKGLTELCKIKLRRRYTCILQGILCIDILGSSRNIKFVIKI